MLDKYYKESKVESINKVIAMVSIFMLCMIPIIMYKYVSVSYSPIFNASDYSSGAKADVFNFFKMLLLNLGTILILGMYIYRVVVLKEEIKSKKLNVVIMIFAIFIAMSALLSQYPDIALFGNYDRHEGAITWFCYLAIFFVLYNTNIDEKYYKYFYYGLIPFIVINLILGIIKLTGYDILSNSLVNSMLGGGLGGQLFTTLYHYNFGSAYASIIFSVSFMYMLLENDAKIKVLSLIMSVLSFVILLTMISAGGFVTALFMLPIIIVIGIRFTNIKEVAIWSIAAIVLDSIVYVILNNINPIVYEESFALIARINDISGLIIPGIVIVFVALVFMMKFVNRKMVFNAILGVVTISIFAGSIFISNTIEKEKKILAQNSNADIVRMKDSEIYQKLNTMSTDRLNIWVKSIDLINDNSIFGNGLDTYPYVMVQKDEDSGISTFGEYIDKPHNWYLSLAYGSGIIALLGLVTIILYITKGTFDKVSDKVDNKYIYIFGIGTIAYAVQGLYNDSIIGTAIIFWIYAGISANMLSKEN